MERMRPSRSEISGLVEQLGSKQASSMLRGGNGGKLSVNLDLPLEKDQRSSNHITRSLHDRFFSRACSSCRSRAGNGGRGSLR